MKLFIEIEMDNAAFKDDVAWEEIRRILSTASRKLEAQIDREPSICDVPEWADKLLDINGNTVGSIRLKKS